MINNKRKINYQKKKLLEAQDHTPRFWYKGVFTPYDCAGFKEDCTSCDDSGKIIYHRPAVDMMLGLDGVFTTGYKILDNGKIQIFTIYDYGMQYKVDEYLPQTWKHGDILTFREFHKEYRRGILNHWSKSKI